MRFSFIQDRYMFRRRYYTFSDLFAKDKPEARVFEINRITLREEFRSRRLGRFFFGAVIKSPLLRRLLAFTTYRRPITLNLGRVHRAALNRQCAFMQSTLQHFAAVRRDGNPEKTQRGL